MGECLALWFTLGLSLSLSDGLTLFRPTIESILNVSLGFDENVVDMASGPALAVVAVMCPNVAGRDMCGAKGIIASNIRLARLVSNASTRLISGNNV